MKLNIMLEMGPPEGECNYPSPENKPSVEDQVRDAIDLIESGHDSYVEWKMLNRLMSDLRGMSKKNQRVQNLIDMIDPVLNKYGMHGVEEIED